MPTLGFKRFLLTDNVDITPAQSMALNPGMFGSINDVPLWAYTSLSTMLAGPSASTDAFSARISYRSGDRSSKASGYIQLIPAIRESVEQFNSFLEDTPGAEYSEIGIYFHLPEDRITQADYDKIKQMELRIRGLVDWSLRPKHVKDLSSDPRRCGPPIPALDPSGLDTDFGMFCKWLGIKSFDTHELMSIYRIEYRRKIPVLLLPA